MTTNPADRVIVALDGDPTLYPRLVANLFADAGITAFKLRPSAFWVPGNLHLALGIVRNDGHLFLDAKARDVPDSIFADVLRAAQLGATWLTVDVRSVVAARAGADTLATTHPNLRPPRIVGVDALTYDGPAMGRSQPREHLDGLVCHPAAARYYNDLYPDLPIFCPAIRPAWDAPRDEESHTSPTTPTTALQNGATYLVVGRPITTAPDPVAAARRIVDEVASQEVS